MLPCQCVPGLPCQCVPGLCVLVVVPTQLFEGNELLQSRSFLGNDNDIFKVVVFHDLGLSSINLQPCPRMRRPSACLASEKNLYRLQIKNMS